MKKLFYLPTLLLALAFYSCGGQAPESTSVTGAAQGPGQSAVKDDVSIPTSSK